MRKSIPGIGHISKSLSARRAWIEILSMGLDGRFKLVALRKESVDRNWKLRNPSRPGKVALRKESVDRNRAINNAEIDKHGRSPQGERG